MTSLDAVLVALAFAACEPRRVGRAAWRADCPSCGAPDALGLNDALTFGLGVLPRCGCRRADVLEALALEEAW
jgi:hypothetical protein